MDEDNSYKEISINKNSSMTIFPLPYNGTYNFYDINNRIID